LDNRYDKYNGLLLRADLHVLFDNYTFSINPDTFIIEFDKDFFILTNDITEYKKFDGMKININFNEKVKINLMEHYNDFINKN
jgi:hypothetical protein